MKKKNQAVEVLRILGAFGIVWFHSGIEDRLVAYSGLSLFIMISLYFSVAGRWETPAPVEPRIRKLLLPWVVWTLIYGMLCIASHRAPISTENGVILGLLAGTSIHLWYLPFMFAVLTGVEALKGRVSRQILFWVSVWGSLAILASAPVWWPWSLSVGAPIAQYAQAAVAVLLGISIGTHKHAKFGLTGLTVLAVALGLAMFLSDRATSEPHLIALLLLYPALEYGKALPQSELVQRLAGTTYGVYLVHPLCLYATKHVAHLTDFAWPVASFALSLALVFGADRSWVFVKAQYSKRYCS